MSQNPVGQPRGLSPLFFTEMWERFSFYGMRAFFATFMEAPLIAGGLGYDKAQSGAVLAMYLSTVYLMSLPGGWIAGKDLGQGRGTRLVSKQTTNLLNTVPKVGDIVVLKSHNYEFKVLDNTAKIFLKVQSLKNPDYKPVFTLNELK